MVARPLLMFSPVATANCTPADLDDPATTWQRKDVLARKPFLNRIYQEWYGGILAELPAGPGRVLEIGTGAGFLTQRIPDLVTSDVFPIPGISLLLDAAKLPMRPGALKAIVLLNVLHHVPRPRAFFRGAADAVRSGGAIVMIEPWNTRWSRLIYTRLHHEPFDPDAREWEFAAHGPLASANGALPWILFERDRAAFQREFPEWRIEHVRPFMPFRYLLSGGFTAGSLQPGALFGAWRKLEQWMEPWMRSWGMFAYVTLRRV